MPGPSVRNFGDPATAVPPVMLAVEPSLGGLIFLPSGAGPGVSGRSLNKNTMLWWQPPGPIRSAVQRRRSAVFVFDPPTCRGSAQHGHLHAAY